MSRQDVQGHIVQILDADGQGLSLEQKSRLVAEFYDKKARSSHPSITAGGCIQLPAEEGELAVVDTKSKANVYLSVRAPMENFQSLRLTKKPNIKFESFCQGENRFAHKQIKRDWNISTDGSLSPIRLLVQARNVHDDQVSFIFQKSFGDELQLPNAWTTELLKEGQYRIEVLVQFLSEGLSQSPQLLGAECPLTILHHAPSILGLSETNTTIQIVDTDKSLDWNSTLEGADLYACLEERSQIPQGSLEEAACQPRVACQLPENFQRVDKIRSKAEGLFNVFVYTKDKADNQSPTQCRTVIFSSQAPQFDLKWAEDRWNHEGAILDTADAVLKAHVSGLSHPEIAAEKLAESLECKVELVLQSIETVSSPRIYCTEGLCRNQTLDVYRPCSPDIGVAIYDFWKASYSNNVTLRLKVRAKDFAGHTREKMRSLIVSNNKWESHIVDGKVPGDAVLDKVLKDQNGYILAVYNQSQIRKFSDDGTAIDVTPPGYVDSLSDALIQSADGHIYFVGIKASGNSEILHWVNSQWEHPGLPEISAKSPGKVGVFIHPTHGFWLETKEQAYYFDGKSLEKCPHLPDSRAFLQFSMDDSNRVWAFGENQIFLRMDDGSWEGVDVPERVQPDSTLKHFYFVDGKGTFWLAVEETKEDRHILKEIVQFDGEARISFPELLANIWGGGGALNHFVLDSTFTPVMTKFIWSYEHKKWQIHPLWEGINDEPNHVSRRANGNLIWQTVNGRDFYELNSNLVFYNLPIPSSVELFPDSKGVIWGAGWEGLYRIAAHPWLDKTPELAEMKQIQSIWKGKQGTPRICDRSGKFWELKDGIWSLLFDFAGPNKRPVMKCFENSTADLFAWTQDGIWISPEGKRPAVQVADSLHFDAPIDFIEDSEGFSWFSCKKLNGISQQLCSYRNGTLTFHDILPFSGMENTLRSFELNGNLFVMGGSGDWNVFEGKDRRDSLPFDRQHKFNFPNGQSLRITFCLAIDGKSALLYSEEKKYWVWNSEKNQLTALDQVDSEVSDVLMMRSADGHLYFSALEARTSPSESVHFSDRIKAGTVFRLDANGQLMEIVSSNTRLNSLDAFVQNPKGYYSDAEGKLWVLSTGFDQMTSRLIQYSTSGLVP